MTVWIVIDESKVPKKYTDRYRVFAEEKLGEAISWAQSRGWKDPFHIGLNAAFGMMNSYSEGDKTISIMHAEVVK